MGIRFEAFELAVPVVHVVVAQAGGSHDFYPTVFRDHVVLHQLLRFFEALRCLSRSGLADLIHCTCRHARSFAHGLRSAGHTVLNDVVLNQVLVTFGDAERTREVIRRIQQSGTLWCGETVWQGHRAMRISVSSWATTEADVQQSLAAILTLADDEVSD